LRQGRVKLWHLAASLLGGVAIAVIAYTAYWFVAADEIGERIAEWAEEQRARGVTVETGEPAVRGYPLHFEVSLERPFVDYGATGWSWRGDAITARFRPWRFDAFNLEFRGHNEVRFFDGEAWHDFAGEIADGTAWLHLDDERRIETVLFDLKEIEVTGPWGGDKATVERLRARAARAGASEDGAEAAPHAFATAAMELAGVRMPEGFGEELGEEIEYLDFDLSLFGPIAESGTATEQAVRLWRDEGGTLELNSFRVRWGPLGIESAGTIALDGEMRPIAALTANIIGYGDIIDALIMSNMIPLGDAFLAKVAFNVIAEKPAEGGPPVLRSVPVTAQDGGLFVGPVSVAKLPALSF
jgi:hypothetical protein